MIPIPNLLQAMAAVPDHRNANTVHPLPSILTMCVCAMLCGAKHPYAIYQWGRDHGARVAALLGFRRKKTPSKWALYDALARLNVDDFEIALARALASLEGASAPDDYLKGRQGASLDGKVLRGTHGHHDAPGLGLVALFAHRTGWVLAQVPIEDTGELGAVRALVADTPLHDKVVTGDALQTQRDVSTAIVEKGGPTSGPSRTTSRRSATRSKPRSPPRTRRAPGRGPTTSGTVASRPGR